MFGGASPPTLVDPNGHTTLCNGYTVVDATGLDGKVWSLTGDPNVAASNWKGYLALINVPNLFSMYPDEVMTQAP